MGNEQPDNIFALSQTVEKLAMGIGRKQMAAEVLSVFVEEKNDGRAIARVLALCTREVK